MVKLKNVRVPRVDMDQIHLPDPVKEDIAALQKENTALYNRLVDLEVQLRELKRQDNEKGVNRKNEDL